MQIRRLASATKTRPAWRSPAYGGVGPTLLLALVSACILVPIFSNYNADITVAIPLQGPSSAHPLGTDTLGRDVLVRLFSAGRLDIALAMLGVSLSWAVGTLVGIGVVIVRRRGPDWVMQRVIDGLLAFPFVLFSLTLVLIFGPTWSIGPLPAGAPATLLAIWFINWALYARLARAETMALVDSDFIVSARLLGFSPARIVVRHMLPIVARTTATYAAGDALLVVSVVAALPFLGVGIQPPAPEWGVMMYEGRGFLSQAPLLVLAPAALLLWFGIGITLTVDRRLGAASASKETASVDATAPASPATVEVNHG